MDSPAFSIIVPDFDGTVDRSYLVRALDSLESQTFTDFEVLLYHDGPKKVPYAEELDLSRYPHIRHIEVTDQRYNDYGHSLRDMGIRLARGEYIIHFNGDNILYPNALQEIVNVINTPIGNIRRELLKSGVPDYVGNDIIVFPIVMVGAEADGRRMWYEVQENGKRCADKKYSIILSGYPVMLGMIDCMQLVMRRRLWFSYGGWYDKSRDSDGVMYQRFADEHLARYVPAVLGEHW